LFVQAINILIVNQSMIDMCASVNSLLIAVVEVDGTRMSRDSIYDQFVCRVWLGRAPLWSFVSTSTYGILITAFERYFAVISPIRYNVSTDDAVFRGIGFNHPPLKCWEVFRLTNQQNAVRLFVMHTND